MHILCTLFLQFCVWRGNHIDMHLLEIWPFELLGYRVVRGFAVCSWGILSCIANITSSSHLYPLSIPLLIHSASLEGIDYSQFDCIYSPAKRRGPVPGKTSKGSSRVPSNYPLGITSASQYNALQQQQIYSSQFGGMNNINNMGTFNPQIQQLTQAINNGTFTSDELKQMLALQQQLLISQQDSMMAQQSNNNMGTVGGAGVLLNNMLLNTIL